MLEWLCFGVVGFVFGAIGVSGGYPWSCFAVLMWFCLSSYKSVVRNRV